MGEAVNPRSLIEFGPVGTDCLDGVIIGENKDDVRSLVRRLGCPYGEEKQQGEER